MALRRLFVGTSTRGLERVSLTLAWAVAVTTALATLVFVFYSFVHRPDNPVEAELVYESTRVARGLALYVDPSIGAFEDGAPPSRFYVLYTPSWPWLVGHLALPTIESVRAVGRALAIGGWLAIHLAPIVAAPREARRRTVLAALLTSGVWFLSRNAPAATPDTVAAALGCVGSCRAARLGRLDGLSAALLVASPLVKPSALGLVLGAGAVHLVKRPPGWIRTVAIGAGVALAFCGAFQLASRGVWLDHIVRSTGQPLLFGRALAEIAPRAFVLGIPHVVVAVIALRSRAPAIVVGPLVSSIAWSTFTMAKIGSGSHYWLEPSAAALIAIAFTPVATPAPRRAWAAAVLAVASACASLPAYVRDVADYRARRDALARIDRHCVRRPGDAVVSTDIGMELALSGRVLVPSWQSSFLARDGRFPLAAWRADLERLDWLVLHFDVGGPPDLGDPEISAFEVELRDVVARDFALDRRVDGAFVYRRRTAAASRAASR